MSSPSAVLKIFPLSSIVLEVWVHGVYSTIALWTLWYTTFKLDASRKSWTTPVILVVMYTAATIHMALSWWFLINAFTNFGATPAIVNALAHTSAWYKALGASMFSLNVLITDCVFIWRCWVFGQRRWAATVIPVLATVAGTVLAIISIVGQVDVTTEKAPGSVPKHFVKFSTPYFGLSLATSLYVALFISLMILMPLEHRGAIKSEADVQIGNRKARSNLRRLLLLEVPAEAAVIYSANLIAFIILTARKNSKLAYSQNIHPQVAGITVAFIILRDVMRHPRPRSAPESSPKGALQDSDDGSI